MSTLLQDLRYSLRVMAGRPGFTAIAVVVLALGIGANSAVFTLVNELLLRPLPAERAPGEIVGIYSKDRARPDNYRGFSYPNFVDVRDGADVFSGVLAEGISLAGVTEGDTTRRSFVFIVSSNYFETLAAHLTLGRVFTPEEERPGAQAQVAVVSYAYWQQHGGQPDILGRTIRMNGRDFQIVGVTPRGFTGAHPMLAPEAYVPIGAYALVVNDLFQDDAAHTSLDDRQNTALVLIGRLKPGVTEEAAAPQLDALARRLEQAYPAANKDQTLVTHRLRRMGISTSPGDDGDTATAFVLLQAMAAVVLIIACLNLANMLLARASARRKEMGIRLALGAGRARIVRQLLVEGFLLSLAGSAAGLVAAYWAIRVLISSFMVAIPFTIDFDPRPDGRVVVATLVFAAVSTIVFGLWPALRLARTDVVPELKEQTGDHSEGRRRWFTLRHALVVAQMALSLGLLTAGGLFVKGAIGAANADPGFPFHDGIVASVDPGLAGYDEARGREIYREILERVRALPGVRAASVASLISYGEVTEGDTVRRPGTKGDEGRASAISNVVGADYFAALGLKVIRGRGFTPAEEQSPDGARVVLVDEPLARKLFPNEDPIGQQVVFVKADQTPKGLPYQIVGVVPGLRHDLFDRAPVAHVYRPFGQNYHSWMNLHVKLSGGGQAAEASTIATLRETLRAVDPRMPVLSIKSLENYRETNFFLWIARTSAKFFATFGLLALFLAVVGIYGVKAYLVSLRTREIGLRMALGAAPRDVLWLVLKDGFALTVTGVVLGLGLSALIATAVSGMVYQSRTFDPLVYSAAVAVLVGASMAATYVPARRAMKVEPTRALRTE